MTWTGNVQLMHAYICNSMQTNHIKHVLALNAHSSSVNCIQHDQVCTCYLISSFLLGCCLSRAPVQPTSKACFKCAYIWFSLLRYEGEGTHLVHQLVSCNGINTPRRRAKVDHPTPPRRRKGPCDNETCKQEPKAKRRGAHSHPHLQIWRDAHYHHAQICHDQARQEESEPEEEELASVKLEVDSEVDDNSKEHALHTRGCIESS
jgi:hypothetical protein